MQEPTYEIGDKLVTFIEGQNQLAKETNSFQDFQKLLTDGANQNLLRIQRTVRREHSEQIHARMHRAHSNDDRKRIHREGELSLNNSKFLTEAEHLI